MSFNPKFYGSEEGWRSASTDSRRHQKNADIKAYIDRQLQAQQQVEKDHNDKFEDDLVEAAGAVVYAGLDKKGHAIGSQRGAYGRNYDKWIASLGEK